MIDRLLPLIPPESTWAALERDPHKLYWLVTPAGLACPVSVEDAPLRAGQHAPSVHRAAFSFLQARTDDGLPGAGETSAKATLLADSPEELQALLSDLRSVAWESTWLVHATEGSMRLIPPTGVDAGATNGDTVEVTLHLVARDLRRYAADGSVMP